MNFPDSLQWLLPPRLRTRKALTDDVYVDHFARIGPDDPALNAISEYGRDTVLSYLATACDENLDERQQLAALKRAMTLARFLDGVDTEREKAIVARKREEQKRL